MSSSIEKSWLVGANGVYSGSPEVEWKRIGYFDLHVNALIRAEERVVAGVNSGVWEIEPKNEVWTQLHDESVTEVLALAPTEKSPGVLVGCPYGIASGRDADHGATRWEFHSDSLRVNERFTNTILRTSTGAFLVGTEAGVLHFVDGLWRRTSLTGMPSRAILELNGEYFAGTDGKGLWRSGDGDTWSPAGTGIEDRSILSLTQDGNSIIAGTDRGVLIGDGSRHWRETGPSVLVTCVGSQPDIAGCWLIGCQPSGLWWTADEGEHWRQVGNFTSVGALIAPAAQREE